jgi:HEAT repeat protein
MKSAFAIVAADVLPISLKELKSEDVETRRCAAGILARLNRDAEKTFPVLKQALKDNDEQVRLAAVAGLQRLEPKKDVILALGTALADTSMEVRRKAAEALWMHQEESRTAAPALIQAIHDSDSEVRWAVISLLYETGLDADTALPALRKAMKHPDPYVRCRALGLLSTLGPKAKGAADEIKEALTDEDEFVCISAAEALSRVEERHDLAIPFLVHYLSKTEKKDDSPTTPAERAAEALGIIGPAAKEAVPELIKLLEKDEFGSEITEALGRIGPDAKAAIPALVARIGKNGHRYDVVRALSQIGPDALPALRKALKDSDHSVREDVCHGLTLMGPKARPALPDVVELVYDPVQSVRKSALECLAAMGPAAKSALPALTEALNDRSYSIRCAAVDAFAAIGPDPDVIAILQMNLENAKSNVRDCVAEALGKMGKDANAAAAALVAACKDADPSVRHQALLALPRVVEDKETLLPILKAALRDENTRVNAAEILWDVFQSTEGLPALLADLEKDWEFTESLDPHRGDGLGYRGAILKRMGPAAKEIVPDLLPFVKDKYGPHYVRAARLLKAIDAEAAKKAGVR